MGTRIALMRDGVLQQVDAPEALYARPRNLFVAGFIGSPKMNLVSARVASVDGEVAIECLGLTMALRDQVSAAVRGFGGKDLIVGLRPEDLRWAPEAPSATAVRLQGLAEVVEPLGSETLVTVVVAGGNQVVARFPPRSGVQTGDRVELALDPSHLHVFDSDSGHSLLWEEE